MRFILLSVMIGFLSSCVTDKPTEIGIGAKPDSGAEIVFDGTREMMDQKWTYWKGPRFCIFPASKMEGS